MEYFKNRKEKRHAEILKKMPYARVRVDVKYTCYEYYVSEIYYYKTPEDYYNDREVLKFHYKINPEVNGVEDVLWSVDFAYYD